MTRILSVENLSVRFRTDAGSLAAVSELSFELHTGECLGIVGESGSGKSQTFMAMFGLLADNGTATGSARFGDEELLNVPRDKLDRLRGNRMAMVFQDALSGLTPTMRVGEQMSEVLMRHRRMSRRTARAAVLESLATVRIPAPARRYMAYPFELSGGMRQRVMIAMATLCSPDLLIADEPTTALDVTVQAQILQLIDSLRAKSGMAVALITHDLGVVAGRCDRVLVMYAGRAVEYGPVRSVFDAPRHPYTRALLTSVPTLSIDPNVDLPVIPGQPPDAEQLPPGCAFADRCPTRFSRCTAERPTLAARGPGHWSACHLEALP